MVRTPSAVPRPPLSTTTSGSARCASARSRQRSRPKNVDDAFKSAARVVHAGRGGRSIPLRALPGLCLGRDQGLKHHLFDRLAEAAFRARWDCAHSCVAAEKVRSLWWSAQSYGRQRAYDAGDGLRVLANRSGKPVRVQTRAAGNGMGAPVSCLDPSCPLRHRSSATRRLLVQSTGFSRIGVNTNGAPSQCTLAVHFRGTGSSPPTASACRGISNSPPNDFWHWDDPGPCSIAPPFRAPLRSAHLLARSGR